MLPRKIKSAFYALCGPAMAINGIVYRFFRSPKDGGFAHLGPGQRNYLKGWINVDANMFTGKCDVWADLRNKLPFRTQSLDAIYSHHVIEHLPDLRFHFKELYRCLKPGGVIRVGGPNGDSAIKSYLAADYNWFSDFPEPRRTLGGRLENYLFCKGEHLTILTPSFLKELAEDAGFQDVKVKLSRIDTSFPKIFTDELLGTEHESVLPLPDTVMIEAVAQT